RWDPFLSIPPALTAHGTLPDHLRNGLLNDASGIRQMPGPCLCAHVARLLTSHCVPREPDCHRPSRWGFCKSRRGGQDAPLEYVAARAGTRRNHYFYKRKNRAIGKGLAILQ